MMMMQVPLKNLNSLPRIKYKHTVSVDVDFPHDFIHEGEEYWLTGKVGNSVVGDEMPCAEYKRVGKGDERVWLFADGEVVPD